MVSRRVRKYFHASLMVSLTYFYFVVGWIWFGSAWFVISNNNSRFGSGTQCPFQLIFNFIRTTQNLATNWQTLMQNWIIFGFTVFIQIWPWLLVFSFLIRLSIPTLTSLFETKYCKTVAKENRDRCQMSFLNSKPYHRATVALFWLTFKARCVEEGRNERTFESERAHEKLEKLESGPDFGEKRYT